MKSCWVPALTSTDCSLHFTAVGGGGGVGVRVGGVAERSWDRAESFCIFKAGFSTHPDLIWGFQNLGVGSFMPKLGQI